MTELNPHDRVKFIDGVRYVVSTTGTHRVVLNPETPAEVVEKVGEVMDGTGEISATQEHLPCIEYPAEVDE